MTPEERKENKRLNPQQYIHPAVGRRIIKNGKAGIVDRVVISKFGPLAFSDIFGEGTCLRVMACKFI